MCEQIFTTLRSISIPVILLLGLVAVNDSAFADNEKDDGITLGKNKDEIDLLLKAEKEASQMQQAIEDACGGPTTYCELILNIVGGTNFPGWSILH